MPFVAGAIRILEVFRPDDSNDQNLNRSKVSVLKTAVMTAINRMSFRYLIESLRDHGAHEDEETGPNALSDAHTEHRYPTDLLFLPPIKNLSLAFHAGQGHTGSSNIQRETFCALAVDKWHVFSIHRFQSKHGYGQRSEHTSHSAHHASQPQPRQPVQPMRTTALS